MGRLKVVCQRPPYRRAPVPAEGWYPSMSRPLAGLHASTFNESSALSCAGYIHRVECTGPLWIHSMSQVHLAVWHAFSESSALGHAGYI